MPLAFAVVIAAIGIGYAMSRVMKLRNQMAELTEVEKKPKRQSKREKRLEQIRAGEPVYVPPSIDDLIAEEIAETGVDRIRGGEGLAIAIRLKAFRRDTTAAEDCAPEDRRFVVADGIGAADAGLDDVRIICEAHSADGSRNDTQAPPNIISD